MMPLPDNVTFDTDRDAYIVWDGDEGTADELKREDPGETVLLYDRTTGIYTPYFITVLDQVPTIKNGRLITTVKEIQV